MPSPRDPGQIPNPGHDPIPDRPIDPIPDRPVDPTPGQPDKPIIDPPFDNPPPPDTPTLLRTLTDPA